MRIALLAVATLAALTAAPAFAAPAPSLTDDWAAVCLASKGDPTRASKLADAAGWQKDAELTAKVQADGTTDYVDGRFRMDAAGARHALLILRDKAPDNGHRYRRMQCMMTTQGAPNPTDAVGGLLGAQPAGVDKDGDAVWLVDLSKGKPEVVGDDQLERAKAIMADDTGVVVHAGAQGDGYLSFEGASIP